MRKRINDISEIYDGQKLLISDFSNLDLSNINLSIIPIDKWNNCIFNNTNFHNTNIRFIPRNLNIKEGSYFLSKKITNCDFSNNDLSYLTKGDFGYDIVILSCDFRNTNLKELPSFLFDCYIDSNFNYTDFFDKRIETSVDINTIIKNPNVKIPSIEIARALYWYVWNTESKDEEEILKNCEEILKYDSEGYLRKFYNCLKNSLNRTERINFFKYYIDGVYLKDVIIPDLPYELLRYYNIYDVTFDNVNIMININTLTRLSEYFLFESNKTKNKYKSISFPNITYSSWQENENGKRRIGNSNLTTLTKVYLELSRECNANCVFCRNKTFDKCEYDLENIIKTINMIEKYINILVIGGGEPTLRLNDVKLLAGIYHDKDIDLHLFTNGTYKNILNDDEIIAKYKINLSRHEISDTLNSRIFGLNEKNILSQKDIEYLNKKNADVTLNATCFKGGLDSFDKIINYISFAKEIGCNKVLISNLQKNVSLGNKAINYDYLYIDDTIFDSVIEYLKSIYRYKSPIIATGGYEAHVFSDTDNFKVSIQKYIDSVDLSKKWNRALKRNFDLSIDPSGNLYENWNQKENKIKTIEKKY